MTRQNKAVIQLLVLVFVVCTASISVSAIVRDADTPDCYSLSFLLPLFFGLLFSLLLFCTRALDSFTSLVVVGCYYVRMVVVPLVKVYGNYGTLASISHLSQYMDTAVLLQIYEMFIVFSFLAYLHHSGNIKRNDFHQELQLEDIQEARLSKRYSRILTALVVYIFLILIVDNRVMRDQFMWSFSSKTNMGTATYRSIWGGGHGVYGILVTVMLYAFFILQMLLPSTLLLRHMQSRASQKKKYSMAVILVVIALLLLVMTGERGNTVLLTGALLLILCRVLPQQYRRVLYVCLPLVAVFAGFALFLKAGVVGGGGDLQKLSVTVSAYFLGAENIAASIAAGNNKPVFFAIQMIGDFLHSIPFLSALISSHLPVTSSVLFGEQFYDTIITVGRTDQLMSPIGQGYQYFGFLLAPLIPCILISIPFWFEKQGLKANNFVLKTVCWSATIFLSFQAVNNNGIIMFPKFLMFYIAYWIAKRGVFGTKPNSYRSPLGLNSRSTVEE